MAENKDGGCMRHQNGLDLTHGAVRFHLKRINNLYCFKITLDPILTFPFKISRVLLDCWYFCWHYTGKMPQNKKWCFIITWEGLGWVTIRAFDFLLAPTRSHPDPFDFMMTSHFGLTRARPKWPAPRAGYFGKYPRIHCDKMATNVSGFPWGSA
jgi:hypothetical protein